MITGRSGGNSDGCQPAAELERLHGSVAGISKPPANRESALEGSI